MGLEVTCLQPYDRTGVRTQDDETQDSTSKIWPAQPSQPGNMSVTSPSEAGSVQDLLLAPAARETLGKSHHLSKPQFSHGSLTLLPLVLY